MVLGALYCFHFHPVFSRLSGNLPDCFILPHSLSLSLLQMSRFSLSTHLFASPSSYSQLQSDSSWVQTIPNRRMMQLHQVEQGHMGLEG